MNNKEKGNIYEEQAARYLVSKGHRILERNYFARVGEIDIISEKDNKIYFSEVKYRRDTSFGYAEDAVNKRKIRKIKLASSVFLSRNGIYDREINILIIAVTGNRIRIYESEL